jgi:WXXGXW repeat (2 copies)
MRKILLSGVALSAMLTVLAAPLPAAAQVNGYVSINVGPPALRVERMPPPRRGYAWVPGYWDWRGKRHVWVAGNWVRERPGYYYEQPRWVAQNGGWVLQRGHWARGDRDRDGIPNRRDRDRDGDGVPNRYDQRPDNPNRR